MKKLLYILLVVSSLLKSEEIYCLFPSTCNSITVSVKGEVNRMKANFLVFAKCKDKYKTYSYKGKIKYIAKTTRDINPKVVTIKQKKKKIICYKKGPGFPGRFSFNLNISKHYIVFQVK